MRKLYLFLALFAVPAFAERAQKGVEVCRVAEIRHVEGELLPQRGIRIYRSPDGSLYGVVIKNGCEQFEFGGNADFTDAVNSALDGIPGDVTDWNVEFDSTLERAFRGGKIPLILDGWKNEIRVSTPAAKVNLARYNAVNYVAHLGEHSAPLGKLKRLLDVIALALGRELMGI